jgi:hypothetical protein
MTRNGNGAPDSPLKFRPSTHLTPSPVRFTLKRDQWGQLEFIAHDGTRHAPIVAVPLFPISVPDSWISIRSASGDELACIEDPKSLEPDVWQLLREELARREFVPVIKRIVRVSGNSEPCEWQVETDRGPTRFVLKSEDDVRRISEIQIVIVDAHGTRYQIPDINAVDAKSRRIVEWYV